MKNTMKMIIPFLTKYNSIHFQLYSIEHIEYK
jgi:hypothetical protein